MKRICVLLVVLLFLMVGESYGAVSYDAGVYVRKDVFDVYMRNIDSKLDMIIEEQKAFREELKAQRQEIAEITKAVTALSERLDGTNRMLSARIDDLDARMGDLRNDIYLGLVILGIIVGLPAVQKMMQAHRESRPAVTL